jgi:Xaa-Pro dipeptidase
LRLAYQVCLDLQDLLVAAAVPGAVCGDLYDLAAAHAASCGYEDHFMGAGEARVSFVGHGVGLEIDELPVLAKGVRQELAAGNVIAIEPKLVFPGVGAVGVENTWRVGAAGAERLTTTPDGLWEV